MLSIKSELRHAHRSIGAFIAGPVEPGLHEESVARTNRTILWTDGFISSASESFVLSFLNPFIMALGATNSQIGILSSLNNLASAAGLIPGARLAERSASRKKVAALSGGVIGRALLLVLAFLPLLFQSPTIIYLVVAITALRAFVSQVGFPAWSTLIADIVPEPIRGRYFSSRNIGMALAAMAFTPIAGWIIERGGGIRGYQIGLLLAGLIGFAGTAVFLKIQEPQRTVAQRVQRADRLSVRAIFAENRQFTAFSGIALIWNLALMIAGPFFSVYLVRTLGATPSQIGILAAVNGVGNIVGQQIWGKVNDRRGARWVMGFTGLLIPFIPILWSAAPNPWWLIPVEVLSGFAWAGYGLANFNLLLTIIPATQRERYIALYQTVVFGAAFIGPLIGAGLANTIGIRPLLFLSSVGRFIASGAFILIMRPKQPRSV